MSKHTFYTRDKVTQCERFMEAPALKEGCVWQNTAPGIWVELTSPHNAESNPNHRCYDLHIFGEHHETFLRRQYK